MNKTYLVALSSAVLMSLTSVIPAQATTTVNCSGGGDFTVSGTVVTRTNPDFSSTCSGTAPIPGYVTEIAADTFLEAENLTSVTFGANSSLTIIRDRAFSASGLTTISIPPSVTTIEGFAFGLIPTLGSVTFEAGSSLQTIGVKAFGVNSALTSVTFRSMAAPGSVSTAAFEGVSANAKLFLEDGATGFGSVGQTWNGLLIASGGTPIPQSQDPTPSAGSSPAFTPPPPR